MGKVRVENTELREKLDILGKTAKREDNREPKKQGLKLNVISGKNFGMTRNGGRKECRSYLSRAIRW